MPTIAIVNEKGGTAKTTTAVSLSAAMGRLGQRVLLVDLDGQAAASRWLGVEEDNRLAEAMIAGGGLVPIPDVAPGVSLAPATGKLDSVAHDLRPSQGGQLRKILRQIHHDYDLIVLDCPPSLGNRLIGNALLAATHALVPVETSILALDGLKILLTTLEDIREGFGHEIVLAGVLACRYDGRTRLSRLVLEELRRSLPGKVFQTVIRENVRMRECPAAGETIFDFAPDSNAAQDYLALAKEMLTHPEAWQLPAAWDLADHDPTDPESEQCTVDSLRANAAASVRAAGRKAPAAATAPQDDAAEAPTPDTPTAPPPADGPAVSADDDRPAEAAPPPRPAGTPVRRFGGPNPWQPAAATLQGRADDTPPRTPPPLDLPARQAAAFVLKTTPPSDPATPSFGAEALAGAPLRPGSDAPAHTGPMGLPPQPQSDNQNLPNLTAYLERLTQAEGRLIAAEAERAAPQPARPDTSPPELTEPTPPQEAPPDEAPPTAQAAPTGQPAAAHAEPRPPTGRSDPIPPHAEPASPQSAAAAAPAHDDQPPPLEEDTPLTRLLQLREASRHSQQTEGGGPGQFPALQALLRKMRGESDTPQTEDVETAGQHEAAAVPDSTG